MKTQHDVLMEDPKFRRLLAIETLVAEASELIAQLMAEQNLTRAELARRLGKSRAWVTQLLSGRTNMTVRTLAEVVHTLEGRVKLEAQKAVDKTASRPAVAGWQPTTFQIDQFPWKAEDVFRLEANKPAPVAPEEEPEGSKYAA